MSEQTWPRLSPLRTGLRGLCPRCGQGSLFEGFLALRSNCNVCGLDYGFADPADGPAFFVMMFAIIPAIIFPLWLEAMYAPPFWVHLFKSLPLLLGFTILPLRPLKGALVAMQYVTGAEEGRLIK